MEVNCSELTILDLFVSELFSTHHIPFPNARVSPLADKRTKKALRTQMSPGLIDGEIRYFINGTPKSCYIAQ